VILSISASWVTVIARWTWLSFFFNIFTSIYYWEEFHCQVSIYVYSVPWLDLSSS
jgi:hypothetical protein